MEKHTDLKLIRISEDKFEIDENAFKGEFAIQARLGLQFQYNPSNRIFKTSVTASFLRQESEENPLLEASGSMMFELSENDIEKYTVDDDLILPTELQKQTALLATGMLRGIVTSQMTAKGLTPAIIPLLDVNELNIKPIVLKRN